MGCPANRSMAFAKLQLSCVLGCLLLTGCSPTIKERAAIAESLAEGIQVQSTPRQVLEYLDNHKIEHSQYQ
jgi:hypothetical protein